MDEPNEATSLRDKKSGQKVIAANITRPDGSSFLLHSIDSPSFCIDNDDLNYSNSSSKYACVVRFHFDELQLVLVGVGDILITHADKTHTVVYGPLNNNNCHKKTTLILKDNDVLGQWVRPGQTNVIDYLGQTIEVHTSPPRGNPCFKFNLTTKTVHTNSVGKQSKEEVEDYKESEKIKQSEKDIKKPEEVEEEQEKDNEESEEVEESEEKDNKVSEKNVEESEEKDNEESEKEEEEEEDEGSKVSEKDEEEEEEEEIYDGEEPREDIIELLSSVEAPGTFAVGDSCKTDLLMPGLTVNGIGRLRLPLSNADVKALARVCRQAPFGRGSKTIIDKKVRNTLQLSPKHFQISNPSWTAQLKTLVKNVCSQMGVSETIEVDAQLYKLLLYEKGSFFKKHRDSEKVDGMFGTLIIALPSTFEGGELVVDHNGETKDFAFAKSSSFSSHFMSFYADCLHELREVTSGHRLCVVYNLVKVGGYGSFPSAATTTRTLKELRLATKAWGNDFDGNKMVFMLEHLYTPASVRGSKSNSKSYKGNDSALVELLLLTEDTDIDLEWDHCTVSYSQSGYANGGCGWDEYYSWEAETDSEMTLELEEHGQMDIDAEKEMIPPDFYENNTDYVEEFEPTGNEGVNAERQYTDKEAIVVWPRSQRWIVLANNKVDRMIELLSGEISALSDDEIEQKSEAATSCISKAKMVASRLLNCDSYVLNKNIYSFNIILCKLKDVHLTFSEFFVPLFKSKKVSPKMISIFGEDLSKLILLLNVFGTECVRPLLFDIFSQERYSKYSDEVATFAVLLWQHLRKVQKYRELVDCLLKHFVNQNMPCSSINTSFCNTWRRNRNNSYPVKKILNMFQGHQNISMDRNGVWNKLSFTAVEALRKVFLKSSDDRPPLSTTFVGVGIGSVCDANGWSNHEQVLIDILRGLCDTEISTAAAFLEELASVQTTDDKKVERHRVCGNLALIVTTKMTLRAAASTKDYKEQFNLFKLTTRFCPQNFEKVTEHILRHDIDAVLIPFINSAYKWLQSEYLLENPNGSTSATQALSKITLFCVKGVQKRVDAPLGFTTLYSSESNISNNSRIAGLYSFLKNPCKKELKYQLRKRDHKMTSVELKKVQGITHRFFQKNGRGGSWFLSVVKTSNPKRLSHGVKLLCPCDSYDSACLAMAHNAVLERRNKSRQKLSKLKSYLPHDVLRNLNISDLTGNSGEENREHNIQAMSGANLSGAKRKTNSNVSGSVKKKKVKQSNDIIDLT
eukprot:GSMAST32.ASY1.ANO1.2461.1 assembled CDS